MSDEIESLIDQWLEGSLDAARHDELTTWLQENPEQMRRFVEANVRHQLLCDVARAALVEDEVHEVASISQKRPRRSTARIVAWASLAACLLIAGGWMLKTGGRIQPIAPFLSVAMIQGANVSELKMGDRLGARTIEIAKGIVRLQFDDGVEVTLQGPANYELIAPGRTRLQTGLLTATVPPGAEGFKVLTPMAEVVDFGTAFGIELAGDGRTVVSVFDGEVEVTPTAKGATKNMGDRRLVREGEAVRVTTSHEIQSSEFNPIVFVKIWPASSGIVESTGAFRFAPPWPRRMGLIQSDTDIFVLPEGYAATLEEPLALNVTSPGKCRVTDDFTPDELPPGTRVKSFLLQFNPINQRGGKPGPPATRPDPDQLKRIVGDITFDRPVLGLIVQGDDLRASDDRFSVRGGQVPQKGRALELSGTPRDDVVELSEDRRTVKLDLAAFGSFSDQVRVIVDQSRTK